MVTVRIESVTFGDCTKKVTLPQEVINAYENSNYKEDNIIIDYVLSECKTFRKYGIHLSEKFIMYFE